MKDRKVVLYPTHARRPNQVPTSVSAKSRAVELERVGGQAADDAAVQALGILCFARDPKALARVRESFDDETVFLLRVEREGRLIVASLLERPRISQLKARADLLLSPVSAKLL